MKPASKKWDNADDRKSACIAVLKTILSDDHFRRDCLASDDFLRQALFEIGGIDVPGNVKVLLVPEGDFQDAKQNHRGSQVLEVPPKDTPDDKLEAHILCTYAQWFEYRNLS
jgi:hypothetical protein